MKTKQTLKRKFARAIHLLDNAADHLIDCAELVSEYPEHVETFRQLVTSIGLLRIAFIAVWEEYWGEFPNSIESYL